MINDCQLKVCSTEPSTTMLGNSSVNNSQKSTSANKSLTKDTTMPSSYKASPLTIKRLQFANEISKIHLDDKTVEVLNTSLTSTKRNNIITKWKSALKAIKKTLNANGNQSVDLNKSHELQKTLPSIYENARNNLHTKEIFLATLDNHQYQEIYFKKPTHCYYCNQIMRGLDQQGLKCKGCKMNVHIACKDKIGTCTRRFNTIDKLGKQRSQPLIDAKNLRFHKTNYLEDDIEPDPVYQLLKNASNFRKQPNSSSDGNKRLISDDLTIKKDISYDAQMRSQLSISAPHSPFPKKKQLNLRMKSFSLDTPDNACNINLPYPNTRPWTFIEQGTSVTKFNQKAMDSKEQDIYLVMENFSPTTENQIHTRIGTLVTAITKDNDWFQIVHHNKMGFVPKHCLLKVDDCKLLQVLQNLQLNDNGQNVCLAKNQVVLKLKENEEGMIYIMAGFKKIQCPAKYLKPY